MGVHILPSTLGVEFLFHTFCESVVTNIITVALLFCPDMELALPEYEQLQTFICRKHFFFGCLPLCADFYVQWRHSLRCPVLSTNFLLFSSVQYQSINQSIDRSIDRSINQSINKSINQSINQSIDRSIDRSINRSVNQSTNFLLFS